MTETAATPQQPNNPQIDLSDVVRELSMQLSQKTLDNTVLQIYVNRLNAEKNEILNQLAATKQALQAALSKDVEEGASEDSTPE